jgi:hypothetical protein
LNSIANPKSFTKKSFQQKIFHKILKKRDKRCMKKSLTHNQEKTIEKSHLKTSHKKKKNNAERIFSSFFQFYYFIIGVEMETFFNP